MSAIAAEATWGTVVYIEIVSGAAAVEAEQRRQPVLCLQTLELAERRDDGTLGLDYSVPWLDIGGCLGRVVEDRAHLASREERVHRPDRAGHAGHDRRRHRGTGAEPVAIRGRSRWMDPSSVRPRADGAHRHKSA